MMERDIDQERAIEDLGIFLRDVKNIGVDNEIIWTIETYVYLENEESDKAIASLTKLSMSSSLSSDDKRDEIKDKGENLGNKTKTLIEQ